MRLSSLIARCEDRLITEAPKAKAAALRTTHKAASWLGAKCEALAHRVEARMYDQAYRTPDITPCGHPKTTPCHNCEPTE